MDLELFLDILRADSTSGSERPLAEALCERLEAPSKQLLEVGDGTANLLLSWGEPRVVFCTHLDTVPPYLPPVVKTDRIEGRGSCDAKGQIFSMYSACKELESRGRTGFALLLLAGEETGSWGAKAFAKTDFRAEYLVVGEPTDNCFVDACKGTKSYDLVFKGEAFHSGYPQFGRSAVEMFVDFDTALRKEGFSFNIGELRSANPQNILSPELTCRVYFRTTEDDDSRVVEFMSRQMPDITVTPRGGDTPSRYFCPEGFDCKDVAFGSDAPHLTNFRKKMICGPGSITVAHRPDEHILTADIEKAVGIYVRLFEQLTK